MDADFGPRNPDNSTLVIDRLHFTLREIVLAVLSHTVETLQALIPCANNASTSVSA